MEQQELIEKIKRLPQERVAEVEHFVDSLARSEDSSKRMNLHQALSDYANQHAGTPADIDPELEAAASDHLLKQDPKP
jgi:predicted transcriptional regulator